MNLMNLVHLTSPRRVGRARSFPVQLMVARGSPAHRGQTAISGCIILGHSAPACGYIRTLYFCEGFIVALALVVWFLYPDF